MTVALAALERFAQRASPTRHAGPGSACELCAEPLGDRHGHVVDLRERSLCCACRPCAILFDREGAGAGRYRSVPDRVLREDGFTFADQHWTVLDVPVRLAFFFHHSGLDRWIAVYPSPAGATEAEISAEAWRVMDESALARDAESDIEALLARDDRRTKERDYLLVPIDVCYELVGLVRRSWRGFDGGEEARAGIAAFFEGLRARSRPHAASKERGSR